MTNAVYYHLGTTMVKLPNQTVHDMLDYAVKRHAENIRQSQHEATWAMAMEAAAKQCNDECHATADYEKASDEWKSGSVHASLVCRDNIRNIPCPPLQTTNEKE